MDVQDLFKNRWLGLKAGFVGFVLAALGFGVAWFGFQILGMFFFWTGWLLGGVGMVLHLRQIFKEVKADPKEIYPPAKQPWER